MVVHLPISNVNTEAYGEMNKESRKGVEQVEIKKPKRVADSSKLDASAWIHGALDMLAKKGIAGVRVESLAKELGVTKGSFYWHFRDREALLEEMLSSWRRLATLALIERLDRGEANPEVRLQRLLRLPMVGKSSAHAADVELAVRLWGRDDARASSALAEVDQLRLRYISGLLVENGIEQTDADARAILAYSYIRVAATLVPADASDTMSRCEGILLGSGEIAPTRKKRGTVTPR